MDYSLLQLVNIDTILIKYWHFMPNFDQYKLT